MAVAAGAYGIAFRDFPESGRYASAFTPEQLQALAYMPLDMLSVSYSVHSVFFAFYGRRAGGVSPPPGVKPLPRV